MKRFVAIVVLVSIFLCVSPVLGVRENFQHYTSDSTGIMCFNAGNPGVGNPFTMAQAPNNYYYYLYTATPNDGKLGMYVSANGAISGYGTCGGGIANYIPVPSTYMAFDTASNVYTSGWDNSIPTKNIIYSTIPSANGFERIEIKIIGGTPMVYVNGVLDSTRPAIPINPSFMPIYYGSGTYADYMVDNLIIGESDHHIVGAIPSNWTIQRDLLNRAALGAYAWSGSSWVLKDSTNFYLDADKEGLDPETVVIKEYLTQTIVNTTSVTAVHNTIAYNISQFLSNPTSLGLSLPDGVYTISFLNSPAITDTFRVMSSGAAISWDQPVYSQGSVGRIDYGIAGSGYWDQATYSYSMVVRNLYGTTLNTQTVSSQSGTISVPISSSFTPGVYIAELHATKISDGSVYTMAYSVMSVTSHIFMNGYVMNAETGAVLPGASMNITQASNYQLVISQSAGNWSSDYGWLSSSPIIINTTLSGYQNDVHSINALDASAIYLNISMMPLNVSHTGVSIGGIVRDNQYGNPVVGATYNVVNGTTHVAQTTNIAGYAIADGLVNGNVYAVWSNKGGYGNSTIANVTAVGS